MEIKDIRKDLIRVYKWDKINKKKFNEVISKLDELKEEDPEFYYYNKGKFLNFFGDPEEALVYLKEAEMYCDTPSLYYNLYKCYIKLGYYDKAFNSLVSCRVNDKSGGNFSLPIYMITSLLDMEDAFYVYRETDYIVTDSNKLFFNELDDGVISDLYSEAISFFNAKDYVGLTERLEEMDDIIKKDNIPLSVESLIILANALKKKSASKYAEMFARQECDDMDDKEYWLAVEGMLLSDKTAAKKVLNEADKLASTDPARATILVGLLEDIVGYRYCTELFYLKNKITEETKYRTLDVHVKNYYDELKKTGDFAYKNGDFALAEEMYKEALMAAPLSIMNYYIGKALFKQGKILQSRDFLLKYAENGGAKYDKCLLFLGAINRRLEKNKKSNKYFKIMKKIHNSFDRDFVYNERDYGDAKDKREDNEDFDYRKYQASRKTIMTEDDFIDVTVDPAEFYNCGLNGKLSIIRGFLKSGNIDIADSLLQDIVPSSRKERKKISQFKKDRKFILRQKRTD